MAKRILPNRSKRPSVGSMTDDDTSSEEGDEYTREAKRKLQDMLDDDSDIDEEYKPHRKKEENDSDDTDISNEEKETLDRVTTQKEKARPKSPLPSRPVRSDTGKDSDTSDTSVEDNPPPPKPKKQKARPKSPLPSRPVRSDTGKDSDTSDTSVEDNPPPPKPKKQKARPKSPLPSRPVRSDTGKDSDTSDTSVEDNPPPPKPKKARPKSPRPSRPVRSDTGKDSDTSDTSVEDNPPPPKPKKPKTYQKRPGDTDMNKLAHFPYILCKITNNKKGRQRHSNNMNRLNLLNLINSFAQRGDGETATKLLSVFLERSAVFVCPETHGALHPVYDMISEMAVRLIRATVGSEVLDEAMKQVYDATSSWEKGSSGLVARHYTTARLTEVLLESGGINRLCDVMKDCTVVSGRQKSRREGVALRIARAVTMMMQDLGQVVRDDDVRSVSGMSVSGMSVGSSLAPDMVVGDLGPIVEGSEDGRMDWIAGLYAGFVSERKGLKFGREILEKYRDKNKQCFSSHHLLLGFLEKNKETSFLLDCLRNLVNEFPWHRKVFDYCDLLLKENSVDSDDSDDSFGDSYTKPKETNLNSNKRAKYMEVVERLVKFLDFPESEGSLKVWALLADSLRRLYPTEKPYQNIQNLFESRSPWWFDQNFGVDLLETYTDYQLHVIAKKMIVAAYLVGTDCFEFCSGLAVLDEHPKKWKQEVFAYVDAIDVPLLDRKTQRQSDFAQEIADEWALIETIKMQSHNS